MDLKERHYSPQVSDSEAPSSRIARSSCAAAGSMMPSHLYQPQKSSTTDTILPPSIALSLRVREDASLSLKRIFDQYMMSNAAASKPERDCSSNPRRRQMGGFQESRNHSSADLRKPEIPDLELIPKKAQDSPFPNTSTGFGSPISSPTSAKQETEVMNSYQKYQIPNAAPALYARRVSTAKPTAQMTIFYSGTVNVYDNISSDKAQAIMVLARNSWSSNTQNLAPSTMTAMVAEVPSECIENVIRKESASSLVKAAPPHPEASPYTDMVNANEVCIAKNKPFLTSAIYTQTVLPIASPPPSPAPAPLAVAASAVQDAGVPVRKATGIELPHARKASLARFLEKRKDRVVQEQLVGEDQHGPAGEKNEVGGGEKGSSYSDKSHDVPTAFSSPKLPPLPSSTRQSPDNISSRENVGASKRVRADDEDDDDCSLRKRSLNEHCFFQ